MFAIYGNITNCEHDIMLLVYQIKIFHQVYYNHTTF